MSPDDFIYMNVLKGAMAKGVSERIAKDHAIMTLDRFKKGVFQGKASKLIEDSIKSAVRQQKASK